jgi:hypothetical protein
VANDKKIFVKSPGRKQPFKNESANTHHPPTQAPVITHCGTWLDVIVLLKKFPTFFFCGK